MAEGAFHRRFLIVSGRQARLKVDASDAHEESIGMNLPDGFNGGSSHRHDRMLEQSTANQDDFYRTMMNQFESNRRTVRRYRGLQVKGQAPGNFS